MNNGETCVYSAASLDEEYNNLCFGSNVYSTTLLRTHNNPQFNIFKCKLSLNMKIMKLLYTHLTENYTVIINMLIPPSADRKGSL